MQLPTRLVSNGETVHLAGHGAAGAGPVLVAAQRAYLERVLALVAAGGDDAAVVAALGREFPGFEPVAAIPDLAARKVAALRTP